MKKIKNKKIKNILRYVILIIAIVLLIFVGTLIYKQFWISKFENMLEKNDSTNYKLVQTDGESSTTIMVLDKVYLSDDGVNSIWISETENIRVIMDKENKLAIITENSEDKFEVGSLNSTYIEKYFENDLMKFKYLGKEDNFYKIQFEDKNTGIITIFYLNKDTGIIEKMIEKFNEAENTYTIQVSLDCVSTEDVAYPDLAEYEIGVSSSTVAESSQE